MGAARITISEEHFQQIMSAIQDNSKNVQAVNMQIAELKGTVAAYASGLDAERKAREELSNKINQHDVILRGDGTQNNPGLVDQVGDVRTRADNAIDGVRQIRNAIWIVGSAIGIAVIVDVILRLLPHIYAAPEAVNSVLRMLPLMF